MDKPRKRLPKRSAKRGKVERADAAWAKAVKERHDGGWGTCAYVTCWRRRLDAHHIFGKKAHPNLRHDVENGIALCREHHQRAHSSREDFLRWFAIGDGQRLARLEEKARG